MGPPSELLGRLGTTAFLRDDEGRRVTFAAAFRETEPVLSQLVDPVNFPELVLVGQALARMRFHHQLRTDDGAPARQSTPGTRTWAVDDDGSNLAAALKTIQTDGDRDALSRCLDLAFDGAQLAVAEDTVTGRLEVQLRVNGRLPSDAGGGIVRRAAALLFWPRPYWRCVLPRWWSSMSPGRACMPISSVRWRELIAASPGSWHAGDRYDPRR